MVSLIHIGFDNSARLWKNVFYLEYKGIRFKLIQNNIRKWCDVLLTIVKDSNNIELENTVYLAASEFLSALGWENNSIVKVWYIGKFSRSIDFRLREMKCGLWDFPKTPFYGHNVNNDLSRIAEIENEEQRDALTLFRDASSTNNDYLSFLFFWQIMEIRKSDPISWINKTYRKNRNKIRLPENMYERIQTNGKKLGDYFIFYGAEYNKKKLFTLLSSVDVCVEPRRESEISSKSTSIKIMEYMAPGQPIVQYQGIESKFSAGEASLYIENNDEYAFGDAIIYLLNNEKKRKEMGEYGIKRVREFFQWDIQRKILLRIYREVII